MNIKNPILLGCHTRQLDANRRLRFPRMWSPESSQEWLLFPMFLFPLCEEKTHDLYLLPPSEHSLKVIIGTSSKHSKLAPTIKAALEVLRDEAVKRSLPNNLATSVQVGATATRFYLSKAQFDWLGCRRRKLILVGAVTAIHLYTPALWAKMQRGLNPS